ncbi:hypothetical protein ACSBR1_029065 [Camellia fascicularis]
MFLPVISLLPQKFSLCFTLGCCLIIGSFFALKGPKNQFLHMSSKKGLPFTLGFIGTMVGTIYFPMAVNSYILSVLFSAIQVLALAYYAMSCFPRGSAGMKFVLSDDDAMARVSKEISPNSLTADPPPPPSLASHSPTLAVACLPTVLKEIRFRCLPRHRPLPLSSSFRRY